MSTCVVPTAACARWAGKSKGVWQADEAVSQCGGCKKGFNLIRRKHHGGWWASAEAHDHKSPIRFIFCDDCCPKGPGGIRKCTTCLTLKGIGEFLTRHPDVAFRMRSLHAFLDTCMMGPLCESRTLQFFAQMETRMRDLEAKAPYAQSAAGKVAGGLWFEKECTGSRGGLTPRACQRRDWGSVLMQKAAEYEKLGKEIKKQLFDALDRQKQSTPDFPESMNVQPDLIGLRKACAVADFQGVNKELLFHLATSMAYLSSLFRSAFEAIVRIEGLSKERKGCKDPSKAAALDEQLALLSAPHDPPSCGTMACRTMAARVVRFFVLLPVVPPSVAAGAAAPPITMAAAADSAAAAG
eukprot:gene54615-28459_t